MRGIVRASMAIGLMVLVAMPALGQQRKGGGGGGGQGRAQGKGQGFGQGMGGMGGVTQLLANSGVQKELQLTEEQVGKVQAYSRDQREKMRDRFQSLGNASPEERRATMAKWNEESKKEVAAFLKPEQAKRLDQIQWQNSGLAAFQDEKVVQALKVTGDQKEKIEGLQRTLMTEMRELGGGPGGGGGGFNPEAMQKRNELQKAAFGKAVALLTDDQKAAWKELTGAPYEVKFEPPRRID